MSRRLNARFAPGSWMFFKISVQISRGNFSRYARGFFTIICTNIFILCFACFFSILYSQFFSNTLLRDAGTEFILLARRSINSNLHMVWFPINASSTIFQYLSLNKWPATFMFSTDLFCFKNSTNPDSSVSTALLKCNVLNVSLCLNSVKMARNCSSSKSLIGPITKFLITLLCRSVCNNMSNCRIVNLPPTICNFFKVVRASPFLSSRVKVSSGFGIPSRILQICRTAEVCTENGMLAKAIVLMDLFTSTTSTSCSQYKKYWSGLKLTDNDFNVLLRLIASDRCVFNVRISFAKQMDVHARSNGRSSASKSRISCLFFATGIIPI